jgi:hypothetical protein
MVDNVQRFRWDSGWGSDELKGYRKEIEKP